MTRHGKNCTAGAVYTYHEKKKDTGEETKCATMGVNTMQTPEETSRLSFCLILIEGLIDLFK